MMGRQSKESMNDTLQKTSLISEQKQTNGSLLCSTQPRVQRPCQSAQVKSLLLCPLRQQCRKAALLEAAMQSRAEVGLRAWLGICTSNVLIWSRVRGEVGLVGTADKTRRGSFQTTATMTESSMRWAKEIHI